MEKMDNSEQSFSKPSDVNFKFAFNDCNFSDRLLRIEIVCVRDSEADGCCNAAADWARQCKRRRHNSNKLKVLDIPVCPEKQTINLDQPDVEERETCENQDEEVVIIDGESPRGDEAAHTQDSNLDMDCSTVVRVKTLHISSPILAAKSPFFYKLFSNGMRESDQRHVTLRIDASEEDSLMEVLQFMYSNTLSVSSAPELLDVLMAADKFEVASCMRYCSHLLRNMPMTPGSALLYLDLPTSVLMAEAVQQLTDAAKQFLAAHYKDINKCHEEVIALPLVGIEAILSSDDLQVGSEDVVYDFVLKWARVHYPNLEERREIMGSRLVHLIRFPHMTCRKLKKVLVCSDFEQGVSSKLVLEALFFKGETPHRQRALATQESAIMNRRFVERTYKFRPVKIVEFQLPRSQCVVYLDLKREEVANLYPSRRVYSQAFQLGGQGFFLSAHCNAEHQSLSKCFGLFLGMQEKGTSASFSVDYEFASRTMHNEEFISKYKGNYKFTRVFFTSEPCLPSSTNSYSIMSVLGGCLRLVSKQTDFSDCSLDDVNEFDRKHTSRMNVKSRER